MVEEFWQQEEEKAEKYYLHKKNDIHTRDRGRKLWPFVVECHFFRIKGE